MRPLAVLRLDGKKTVVRWLDRDRLWIGPVVSDANDAVRLRRHLSRPVRQRVANAGEGARRAAAVDCEDQLRQRWFYQPGTTAIGPTAEIGAEPVMVIDHNPLGWNEVGAESQASALHVDGNAIGLWLAPPREVAAAHAVERDRLVADEHHHARGRREQKTDEDREQPVEFRKIGGRCLCEPRAQVFEKSRRSNRSRHVQLTGESRLITLAPRAGEQGGRLAERTEVIAEVTGSPQPPRFHPVHSIAAQPPQEKADVLDVVPAVELIDWSHVNCMRRLVEGTSNAPHALDRTNIGRAQCVRPDMVAQPLRPAEQLEKLDRMGSPAGDVARELFEHGQRTLASSIVDRLGHVGATAEADLWTQRRPDKVVEQNLGGVAVAHAAFVEQR